jgi:adenylate cyclase
MSEPNPAAREIEQTLRLAGDAIERDVARYRVWVFAAIVVVTAAMHVPFPIGSWIPTLFFLGCLAYAIGFRALVSRIGAAPWILHVVLLIDLLAVTLNFQVISTFAPPEHRADNGVFAAYIAGPALLLNLVINALRYSRTTSVLAAIAAPVCFLGTVVPLAGFHPAQIPVAAILFLAALVSMAAAAQARKNLDRFARLQLLRRYLQPAAVERVMREDPDAALALGGRLATVTLLAADLRGFTALSEKLAPREVVAQLNAYHGAMMTVIERHGGVIDKFMGDGTLVVFGLDAAPEQGATAAVHCAGEMLSALALHNEERTRLGQDPLRMGIGVHTGPVIAGNIGAPGRRIEFTVIGDAVNTASRLEGLTKERGAPVLVSSATVELLADRSGVRQVDAVSIRGKELAHAVFVLREGDLAVLDAQSLALLGGGDD